MHTHHSREKQYFMRKKYEEYEAKATAGKQQSDSLKLSDCSVTQLVGCFSVDVAYSSGVRKHGLKTSVKKNLHFSLDFLFFMG